MKPLRLYLFGNRLVPYFEYSIYAAEQEWPEGEPRDGGKTRWRKIRVQIIRLYKHLEANFPFDEKLCAALLSADEIQVHYSPATPLEKVRKAWSHYLHHQRSRHHFWMCLDVGLACLGALLMPLPGPNLFFFYPAVRAYSHYYSWKGARHGNHFPFRFEPSRSIQTFESQIHGRTKAVLTSETTRLADDLNLPGLCAFLSQKKVYH